MTLIATSFSKPGLALALREVDVGHAAGAEPAHDLPARRPPRPGRGSLAIERGRRRRDRPAIGVPAGPTMPGADSLVGGARRGRWRRRSATGAGWPRRPVLAADQADQHEDEAEARDARRHHRRPAIGIPPVAAGRRRRAARRPGDGSGAPRSRPRPPARTESAALASPISIRPVMPAAAQPLERRRDRDRAAATVDVAGRATSSFSSSDGVTVAVTVDRARARPRARRGRRPCRSASDRVPSGGSTRIDSAARRPSAAGRARSPRPARA